MLRIMNDIAGNRRLDPGPAGNDGATIANQVVAVVGLGYVGLPLAVEFGRRFATVGFDLSQAKIDAYRRGVDPTGEVSSEDLKASTGLSVSTDAAVLRSADFIVVAVPTPVDEAHQPDFRPLLGASEAVGAEPETRGDRRLRIDRLSGRDRGDLRPGARAALRHAMASATSSSAIHPSASTRATASTR